MTDSVALLKRKNMTVKYFAYKTKLKLTLLRNCRSTTSFQRDSFLHYYVLTFPGREKSGLPLRVSQTRSVAQRPQSATAQSRLARVRCGAELARQVKCGAGPGESSLSAAQSRLSTARQRRVDFKSRVTSAAV